MASEYRDGLQTYGPAFEEMVSQPTTVLHSVERKLRLCFNGSFESPDQSTSSSIVSPSSGYILENTSRSPHKRRRTTNHDKDQTETALGPFLGARESTVYGYQATPDIGHVQTPQQSVTRGTDECGVASRKIQVGHALSPGESIKCSHFNLDAIKEEAIEGDCSPTLSSIPTHYVTGKFTYYAPQLGSVKHSPVDLSISPSVTSYSYLHNPDEAYLMQVFVENVAVWMDSLDVDQHFGRILPHKAVNSPVLLNAMLACGARHLAITLARPSFTANNALIYYHTATTLLLRSLQNPARDTAECAVAAVVLNVYEIMSERPTRQMVHVAGARALVHECGWDAKSVGMGRACFWVNVCMEVLSCLAWGWEVTWRPEMWEAEKEEEEEEEEEMMGAIDVRRQEAWVHRIFCVLAMAVNFRAASLSLIAQNDVANAEISEARLSQWHHLTRLCDDCNAKCPRIMQPLIYIQPQEGSATLFPQVW